MAVSRPVIIIVGGGGGGVCGGASSVNNRVAVALRSVAEGVSALSSACEKSGRRDDIAMMLWACLRLKCV